MQTSARILVLGDSDQPSDIQRSLLARGYAAIATKDRSEALLHLVHDRADVAIVDGNAQNARALLNDAEQLASHARLPIIAISPDGDSMAADSNVDVILRPYRDIELYTRLDALGRLVTMQQELIRRAATSREFGVEVSEEIPADGNMPEARVLVVAESDADIKLAQDAIGRAALLSICEDYADAIERLLRNDFDAVVVACGTETGDALNFCTDLRSNSRLYNTPALLLADLDSFENAEVPYAAGANDVAYRPIPTTQLLYRCLRLAKQHRYRMALQLLFRDCKNSGTVDALTGLFNHGYLHAHLERQIAAARGTGKSLTVGVFEVADMARLNETVGFVGGDRLLRQLGGLITRLVRVEDLPARLSGHRFAVVLPDTPLEAARPVLHRLAGVINQTDFAVPGCSDPISVSMVAGSAELQTEEDPVGLVARARADLST